MSKIPTPFINVGNAVLDVTDFTSVWVVGGFFDGCTIRGERANGEVVTLLAETIVSESKINNFLSEFKTYRDAIYDDQHTYKPFLDYKAAFSVLVTGRKQIVSARRGLGRYAFFMTVTGDKKKQVEYGVLTESDTQTAELMGMLIDRKIVVE